MPEAFNLIYDTSRALLLAWTLWAIAHKLQPTRPRRILTVGVMAGYIACLILTYQMPYDFKRFWQVGTDLWAGVDYYSLNPTGERQLILNPPTILPLFQLWALFPLQDSAKLWTALNAVCVFGLVPLAYLALTRQGTGTQHQLSRPTPACHRYCSLMRHGHGVGLGPGFHAGRGVDFASALGPGGEPTMARRTRAGRGHHQDQHGSSIPHTVPEAEGRSDLDQPEREQPGTVPALRPACSTPTPLPDHASNDQGHL